MTGEHFAPDIVELIRLLHTHEVRFVLVGGEAVIYHGYPRLTGDVDLFFDVAGDNPQRLYGALREFWSGPVPAVASHQELEEPGLVLMFGRPPNRVDFLNRIDGVDFDEVWQSRVPTTLRSDVGDVPLAVIGLDALVKNKRASGRHKDLDDVEHLDVDEG